MEFVLEIAFEAVAWIVGEMLVGVLGETSLGVHLLVAVLVGVLGAVVGAAIAHAWGPIAPDALVILPFGAAGLAGLSAAVLDARLVPAAAGHAFVAVLGACAGIVLA